MRLFSSRRELWIQVVLVLGLLGVLALLVNNLAVNLIRTGLGLSFGWLSDRFSVRKVMAVVIAAQFSGQFLMFSSVDYLTFAIGASLFGYGVGGVVPMHGAVVGKTFGRDRFGAVLGLMRPAMFPIQILGVPLRAGFSMSLVLTIRPFKCSWGFICLRR